MNQNFIQGKFEDFFFFWKDNASSLMIRWAQGFNEKFQFYLKKKTFIGHICHML